MACLADMEFQFECVLEFDRRNRTFIQHFECFFYMNTCGLPCSLHFKMADNRETSDVTPTTKAKKFNWNEDDVEKLIDLYEARPCLWDIADPTYSKRDIKEKAL